MADEQAGRGSRAAYSRDVPGVWAWARRKPYLVYFVLNLIYLACLAIAAYHYLDHDRHVAGIADRGMLIPIAWCGSLGAVMASLIGIRENAAKWKPHLGVWYIARPLAGAVFGGIGYLIYIAIVQASVTKSGNVSTAPTALGYVIAFTLGYREETFRGLLQRVTDLLVSAGGGDIEPPSTPSDLGGEVVTVDSGPGLGTVRIWWTRSSDNVGVAGYNVYVDHIFRAAIWVGDKDGRAGKVAEDHADRSGAPGAEASATPSKPDLRKTVAAQPPGAVTFEDRSVVRPRTYLYSVSAFDRAGNESEPAGPIRVHVA